MRQEILNKLGQWENKGLIPLKELRTMAGKASWRAGIYR